MFIKRFLCLINGFCFEDEYLQFVMCREAFKRTEQDRLWGKRNMKKTRLHSCRNEAKSIKLKGKNKDQSGDADKRFKENVYRV